jgi:hypothetical protein
LSLGNLFFGDAEKVQSAKGQGADAPIGGDVVPFIADAGAVGSMPIQPTIVGSSIMFADYFQRKVYEVSYSLDADAFVPAARTLLARHLENIGFTQHPAVYAQEPNSIVYFLLRDGQIACLTFNKAEQISAWSRIKTEGAFESIGIIPGDNGHRVWAIVRRTIGNVTRRYIEIFEDMAITGRAWTAAYTHAAVFGVLLANSVAITGLSHLNTEMCDVVVGENYLGQFQVSGGSIALNQSFPVDLPYEVGLHYDSTLRTMRPAVPNAIVEGQKRQWTDTAIRLKDTVGGFLNGERMVPLTDERPYTGLVFGNPTEADYDGYLTLEQREPYPFTVLSVSGNVGMADGIG